MVARFQCSLQGYIERLRGIFRQSEAQRVIDVEKASQYFTRFINNAPGVDAKSMSGAAGIGTNGLLIRNHRRKHRIRFGK